MPKRRCLDCGQLYDREDTGTWRCTEHQAVIDQRRRARLARLPRKPKASSAARGYGPIYRRRRDQLVRQVLAAAAAGTPVKCCLCPHPLLAGQAIVAHHPDGRPRWADQNTCRLLPAHKSCNERAGNPLRLLTPSSQPLTTPRASDLGKHNA